MRFGFALTLALLWNGAAAQFPGHRHGQNHRPRFFWPGGDNGRTVTLADNAATTETQVPGVVVYVDEEGSATRTTTELFKVVPSAKLQPTPAGGPFGNRPPFFGPVFGPPIVPAPAPPLPPPSPPQPTKTISSQSPPSSPIPKINPGPTAGNGGTKDSNSTTNPVTGVTYSPYNADGTCRSASDVYADFQQLAAQQAPPYTVVRIYGVDCDQVAAVLPAARAIGVKMFLGIFNLDGLDEQVATLVRAVQASEGGWGLVDTISVGNELINNGQATPRQVVDAVAAARASLRSAGYQGPVVTVDTFLAVERFPVLCDASDYCAINVHPFFDGNTAAGQAGQFVLRKVADVREVLLDSGKKVVVTESGWPWQGNTNGLAVPGRQNQKLAVQSIVDVYGASNPDGLILFTAFDDGWKKAEAGTFYAEQFWGMYL